ncbi:hypothetical protein JY424_20730, partial [Stenotrophomonas maltophilia]|nr:hypothetical protein [Stenotrophomonas maltophilia]
MSFWIMQVLWVEPGAGRLLLAADHEGVPTNGRPPPVKQMAKQKRRPEGGRGSEKFAVWWL